MRQRAREAGTPIGRSRAWRAALAVCCVACLWPAAVQAQVSGSVGVVSDYRYRGYSLSDGDPALQASVGYDAASGAYGGVFASTTRHAGEGGSQWIPYAGFARRDRHGRSWDVGLRAVTFTEAADYAEAHVGVAFRRVTLRLHYAPDYHGATDNAYFEADFAYPLGERTHLLLHGGVARSGEQSRMAVAYDDNGGGGPYPYARAEAEVRYTPAYADRTRFDFSAGVVIRTGLCDVQAAWHTLDGNGASGVAAWSWDDRSAFVVGCVKRW